MRPHRREADRAADRDDSTGFSMLVVLVADEHVHHVVGPAITLGGGVHEEPQHQLHLGIVDGVAARSWSD